MIIRYCVSVISRLAISHFSQCYADWRHLVELVLCLVMLTCPIGATPAVPCFCTENRCTHGYCESPWCLVGIQHNGRVIRTCGNDASDQLRPCLQDIGEWQDVCACTTPYCNTFAFLRYEIRSHHGLISRPSDTKAQGPAIRPPPQLIQFDRKLGLEDTTDSSSAAGNSRRNRKKGPNKDDPIIFDRNDEKDGISLRQSYLIVVLIVVPLSIAATAIAVVIVGYYCKMC